jgi:hypothetical protein
MRPAQPQAKDPMMRFRVFTASISLLCWVGALLCYPESSRAQATEGKSSASKDQPDTKSKDTERDQQKEAEEAKRLTDVFLREQKVFIRRGEGILEMDVFYNRNNNTSFLPGTLITAPTTTRFIDTVFLLRYGAFTDGLEFDLIAPMFVHAEQTTDLSVTSARTDRDRIGDIGGAVRYQLWYEYGARPSVMVDANWKSITGGKNGLTGTGNWNAGGGVTLIKTIDPVVFFGRVGYTHNFPEPGRSLGDIVDYRFGMGFSLNDRVSFNVQFTGALIQSSQLSTPGLSGPTGTAGAGPLFFDIKQTEIMNLLFSTTILVTNKFFVEPIVGIPLTDRSFSIVGIRLPYRF